MPPEPEADPVAQPMRWLRGVVLEVLASTYVSLSGRKVAALSNGRLSQKGTSLALRHLRCESPAVMGLEPRGGAGGVAPRSEQAPKRDGGAGQAAGVRVTVLPMASS